MFCSLIVVNVSGCENLVCAASRSSPFHVMGVIGYEGASPPRRRIIRYINAHYTIKTLTSIIRTNIHVNYTIK